MNWQLHSIGQFYDRDENMVVYFDPASGDTHLISAFAAYLIKRIADGGQPLNEKEIIELVAADIEPEDLPEFTQAVPDILRELATLDIVAPD